MSCKSETESHRDQEIEVAIEVKLGEKELVAVVAGVVGCGVCI